MKYVKVNVLVVSYCQAGVIGRNLDSILQQKEFGLNEIVICDDCSPDNNWDVIQSYKKQYPSIIRAYRNPTNLGIYGNSDKVASLCGDADLFCWLEGDDALEPTILKDIQQYVLDNNIDTNDAIGIFSHYSSIDVNGNKQVHHNRFITNKDPYGLYIRGLITWRAAFFSKQVISQFKPTIQDQGLALAESLFDSQWFRYVSKIYECDVLGSIYYSGIGISTSLGYQSDFHLKQALTKWVYIKDNIASNSSDKNWCMFKICRSKYLMKPTLLSLLKALFYYFRGMKGYGYSFPQFKSAMYPFVQRIWASRQ